VKLGPHIIGKSNEGYAYAARAGFMVSLDNVEALRNTHPDAVRLFRHYFHSQDLDADPAWVAGEIISALGGYRHPRLFVQIYVGVGCDPESTAKYIRLCQRVVPILRATGLRVAGPGWFSGSFTEEAWRAFREATVTIDGVAYRWCGFERICVQGYWFHGIGPTQWNAHRYRLFWQPGDPPVQIGECCEDEVRDGPNGTYVGRPGWKANDGASPERTRAGLVRFAAGLEADHYVEGAAIYTFGVVDPKWAPFAAEDLYTEALAGPAHYLGVYDGRLVSPSLPDTKTPTGGTPVSLQGLRLALIPSCQNNRTVDGSTEAELMHGLARAIRDVACGYEGVECRVFDSPTESDYTNLPNLTDQIVRARTYLDAAPAGVATVTVHLHSDALYDRDDPTKGHVVAMHSSEDISKRLAGQLGELLGRLFYGARVDVANGEARGLRAFTMSRNRHCVQYLECGVHQLAAHVRIVREQSGTIGRELTETILRFLVLPVKRRQTVDAVTDALNGVWHWATQIEAKAPPEIRAEATELKKEVDELKAALKRA
jgi:hypothetical protein